MARRILLTAALPYANGPIHIGHLVEYVQADIWARYHKSCGRDCVYVCAEDTHGTPIMLRAQAEGVAPEALIECMKGEHERDFAAFDVAFDNFYTTHSPENRALTETFYRRLREKGHIETRTVEQAYCESCAMFLPDRYIRGKCPRCGAGDQYGDSCEACGAAYSPTELTEARCAVCGSGAARRTSEHGFFLVTAYEQMLREWVNEEHLHPHVVAKLQEWFDQGLRDWNFTRDAPYWGFKIPDMKDKYFYVWWDAPIGYIASTEDLCKRRGCDLESYWVSEEAELYHFIGKDILYFHGLYWPAMLAGAGFRTPVRIWVHGFLTVDGYKMSKSRGTFVNARTYLAHLDPQYLRYYYACKLGQGIGDIDLSTQDFVARVNADLVGNFANLPSRAAGLLARRLENRLGRLDSPGRALVSQIETAGGEIGRAYESCEYSSAVRLITAQADALNRYMEREKPWKIATSDPERARTALTAALNGIRLLAAYLGPILPRYAEKVGRLLGGPTPDFTRLAERVEDRPIGSFERLAERVDPEAVEAMIEETKAEQAAHADKTPSQNE
ncbi:MAG TPA: methionine--tRNA ligase [Phycisphaerae bacterium]|nr:methionine--tRNA ligase [Phycisphaerae bacterium]